MCGILPPPIRGEEKHSIIFFFLAGICLGGKPVGFYPVLTNVYFFKKPLQYHFITSFYIVFFPLFTII